MKENYGSKGKDRYQIAESERTDCAHGAAYDTRKETELFCAILNRFTKFCGMPEPVDIEIDYNNSKNKECDTELKDSSQDSCVCDSD